MAWWTKQVVYVTNQPPGVNDGGYYDPSAPRVPLVAMPCVYLSAQQQAALVKHPALWEEIREEVRRALLSAYDVSEVTIYGEHMIVLDTWRREDLI